MSTASLSTGNGPGSSIALAPETIRVRDALIEKFNGAPLEEMNNFMAMALSNESDELRRLGILAARIYILRNRVANLKEFNRNPSLTSLPELDTTMLSLNLPSPTEAITAEESEASPKTDQWSRIQMTEPGEVNGVRFLTGTVIDAQTEDANKLIRSGKAVRIELDDNIIDHQGDNIGGSDTPQNSHDEDEKLVDDDMSISTASDDDISTPTTSDDTPVSDRALEASDDNAEVEASEAEANDAETSDAEADATGNDNENPKGSTP